MEFDFSKKTGTTKFDFSKPKTTNTRFDFQNKTNTSDTSFQDMRQRAIEYGKKKKAREEIIYRLQGVSSDAIEERVEQAKSTSLDEVQDWFDRVQKFGSTFKQADTTVYTPDYGNEYIDEVNNLMQPPENALELIFVNAKDNKTAASLTEAYNENLSFIKSAKEHIDSVKEYYGQFKNETEFQKGAADWLADGGEVTPEKVQARKNIYQSNKDRIAEIDNFLDNHDSVYVGERRGSQSNTVVTNSGIKEERKKLQAENAEYERTQGAIDKYFEYTQKSDFNDIVSKAEYDNTSYKDIQEYIDLINPDNWKTDNSTGETFDKNGNLVPYEYIGSGRVGYSHPEVGTRSVEDPLALYFNLSADGQGDFVEMQSDDYVSAVNDVLHSGSEGEWHRISEDEIKIYYYIKETEGSEKARRYLDDMTAVFNKRGLAEQNEEIAKAEGLEAAINNVMSVPANVFGGVLGAIGDVGAAIEGKEYNPYAPYHNAQNFASTVREETAKDIIEATNGASLLGVDWGDVYSAGMSGVDSLTASTFGGTAAGVLLGTSSATSEMKRLYEEGASGPEIFFGGVASGAAEMVFEKYSIDKLIKIESPKTVKQFVTNALKQGGVEASEEAFTTIANTFTDTIIRGSTSDLSKAIDTYMASGMSQGTATVRALGDVGKDVWKSAAGGFISGIGMGGTASAPALVDSKIQNRRISKLTDKINELEFGLEELSDPKRAKTVTKGITDSAIKSASLGGTTKQAMLDNMSERGYTPSEIIESKIKGAKLSEEAARAVNEVTDKLDAAFASAWYGTDGVAAGREAASVYVQAAAIGDAVSALKLASDVAGGRLTGKAAERAIKKAAELLPASVRSDYNNAADIISAANDYINAFNTALAPIANNTLITEAMSDAIENTGAMVDPSAKTALNDMLFNGNIAANIDTVLADPGATEILAEMLGMDINGATERSAVIRKVRDMINTYRAGQGSAFSKIAARKSSQFKYYENILKTLNCKDDVISGFKNAILNGKLTKKQARAIAADPEAFELYVKATAGRLGANPTIDDMIKAAGYVAGFDLSGGFSPYYDNGYTNTVESDTLVTGEEVGIYDPSTGTVTLNKKAPLNKKLAYRLAREIVSVNYPEIDESVLKISKDGELFKKISESNKSKYTVIKEYLIEKFYGEEIHLSDGKIAIIDKRDARELSHLADDKKTAELSNLKEIIKRAKYSHSAEKVTHNKFSSFSYYSFSVEIDGERLDLLINVGMAKNDGSHHIYDITKDKKRRAANQSSTGLSRVEKTDAMKNSSSINSISESNKNVNSLTNNILTYMRSHGYNMDSERNRVAKKLNPYFIEHRSRLNSSLLSEDNLNQEIAADFLTKVFTEPAEMEKLADNDLDLAVDLAERVKAFADTATDKQMKDFANDVFSDFYNLFRSEKVNSIKFGDVLKKRRENGLSYEGVIEADSKTGKFEKDAKNRFQKTKDNLSETLNDMRRDWVDYGEAVGRLAKIIGMDEKKVKKGETSLYAYYNSIRQAKASAEIMITKRAINLDGDEVGKSLVDIFKPFYEKGVIKEFDEYIQLLNNSERAKNGKAIKKGLNSEESIYRAKLIEAKHPEFIDARNNYYKFMDNLLQMRVESGLLSKEGADTIKNSNKHYAPAFFFEKESGISPYFEDSIVVSKGVKKATGGDGETMPVFQASAIVASQVVFESRLNRFLVVVENKLKEKGMISEIDGEFVVNDPKVSKFFRSITPTTNKHIRKPQNIEGVYITPKATSELADDIKRLFDYSDNKKEVNKIVREFSKLVTLHENYNAPTINSLLNDLRELGAKRNDKTIKKTDIERNMEDIAEMSSVYDVPEEKLKRTGKRPKDTFNEFFDSLGNNIHTKQFGDIALSNSSAKSEVRHGITAEKIASIEAIPDVLQKGKVIFSETKPDSDVQRIVVCAPIKIGAEPYYMGVMIQKDSRAQRLYLHNVVIEKEMSATSQADRLTNGALEEQHLYITNIIQKALEVKYDKKIVSDTKVKVHSAAEPIVELCNNAVRKAKKERIEIAQKYDSEKFQNYDIESLNNMSHSLDEQDGRHIFYYNNGIRRAAIVGDGMYEAVKHLKHISDAQRADNWVRKINTTYKKMLTSWQPDFAARNAVKDFLTANISTHRTFWIYDLYYFRTLLYDIWGHSNSKYYKEFEALGGFGGTYFDYDQFIRLEVEDTIKNKLRKGAGYITLATPAAALNERIEALPRLAEYIAERKKGKSKIEAMYSAAEITVNFGRAGITGKRLNATAVPFLNASIQGMDKLIRLFKERTARGLLLTGLNLVLLGFGTKAANDFIHSLVGGDDDDEIYDQLTDYQKQNNILIPTGDGKYFKIPKGRELAALAIVLDGAGEAISGEDVDWWGVIRTASEQVTPNNPLTNNLFSAMSDVKNNKTWYGTDIVDQGMAKRADELQYDEDTSRIAVWLGSVFKYSPKKIDYLLGQYGTYVTDVVKDATTPSKNENVAESATTLLAGAFIIDGKASNRVSSDFYGVIASLEEEKTDWRIENRVPATVACKFMNSFDKEIEELYNEISEVNSKDLSAAESTEQIREIKTKITAIMLGAMEEKEKVYAAAEKMNSEYAYEKDGTYYNEIGEELTEEAYIDIIYREVNREVFGAEYALQTYNADTYANATEAVKNGATYDLYYDAYFGTKNIEGDYDIEKERNKTGTERANRWVYINGLDASKTEKVALARTLFEIDDDKIKAAQDSGVDLYDYIVFLCDTGVMSSSLSRTKKEKVLGYINRMQISRKEKDAFYLLAGYSEKTISDAPWR